MDYLHLSIRELHKLLKDKVITPKDLVDEALRKAKKDDNNAFEYIMEKEAYEFLKNIGEFEDENYLWGIPFAIKDNFSTKDVPTTASSDILKDYVPIFNSEIYQRLIDKKAIPIGKTTMDELAMGGSGTTGHLGATFNPWDETHTHQIGGSSCGSASIVAKGIVPFSIGSDTGDSIRKPASFGGIVGLKPTWGRLSRYGLFPFATSLDHAGFFTRNVFDSALLLEATAGRDDKDASSSLVKVDKYTKEIKQDKKYKIAVIKEIYDSIENKNLKDTFNKNVDELRKQGHTVEFVHMDEKLLRSVWPVYYVISCAEVTSNTANLDGIKFGSRIEGKTYQELMTKTRSNGFSNRIKRRLIAGSYSLLKENQNDLFLKAKKARRLFVNSWNKIFEDYDAIYCLATPSVAPLFSEETNNLSDEYSISENYMAIANFGGFPSLTLPLGFENNLPYGVTLTCKPFDEVTLFNVASIIENITGLANIYKKGAK